MKMSVEDQMTICMLWATVAIEPLPSRCIQSPLTAAWRPMMEEYLMCVRDLPRSHGMQAAHRLDMTIPE